ncbi:MAG: hypothetical protein R2867_01765 [Caldilineaceae bacterium]
MIVIVNFTVAHHVDTEAPSTNIAGSILIGSRWCHRDAAVEVGQVPIGRIGRIVGAGLGIGEVNL